MLGALGCAGRHEPSEAPAPPPQVVAVAPLLNLSNRSDWDALQVTDMLAMELQALPDFVVVPVDRVLAAVLTRGQASIATPADVRDLGRALDADLVIVAAITDFDPYDPPRVAMTVQCYRSHPYGPPPRGFDPVTASRQASDQGVIPPNDHRSDAPFLQVQIVHDASWEATLRELREYAKARGGDRSPFGWRAHAKSQELFLRFSCHSAILTIRQETERYRSNQTSGTRDGSFEPMSEPGEGT